MFEIRSINMTTDLRFIDSPPQKSVPIEMAHQMLSNLHVRCLQHLCFC